MKIAHVVCTYPPYYGGMGNVAFQMAEELSRRGHTVQVFTPEYIEKKEIRPREAPNAPTHAPQMRERIAHVRRLAPSLSYGNAAFLPQIKKELEAWDVVHLHYPFFGTAGAVRSWKREHPKKALVMTYHMDTRAPSWKGLAFALYAKFFLPKMIAAADAITVSSFDYLKASDAAALFRAAPDKWKELPFGVDTDRFAPREPSEALLDGLNLSPDRPVIIFVGGMDNAHHFKGIPVLLKALALLKQKTDLGIQAVLVGDGELRKEYEARAALLGIQETVRFAGHVSDEELPLYYNLADLFVLPSTDKGEAFGMVLLEALSSGVPVVATDLPGVRTIAQDGGQVVVPNDPHALAESIAGFFEDTAVQKEWRERARRLAERYQWRTVVDTLEDLYRSLVP